MVNLNQSQSIKLGLVLEACIAPMLASEGFSYNNSESYANLLTRPDFIIFSGEQPIASIAVTTTSNGETWIKKRWRYIDEVGQLKSYFGPAFLVTNIFYGDISVMQESELKVIDAFFDASISAADADGGKSVYEAAIQMIIDYPDNQYTEIANNIIASDLWATHCRSLMQILKSIIDKKDSLVQENIFRQIWEKEHPTYLKQIEKVRQGEYSQCATYLRYSMINGLLVGKKDMEQLINAVSASKMVTSEFADRFRQTDFEFSDAIQGKRIADSKLINTIRNGFTADVYSAIEGTIISTDTQRYLLLDIQDKSRIDRMVETIWDFFDSVEHISWVLSESFKNEQFMGITHVRVWPLDVACAIIDESISSLSRDYTAEFGHIEGLSSVKGFITKTELLQRQFANSDVLNEFCENLARLLYAKLQTIIYPSKQEVKDYLSKKKRADLDLQPYINPLQRYVEYIFDKSGFEVKKTPLPCMLGSIHGIPTQMKKIYEIYQITKGNKTAWVKCIGGYDGVKDKTREMAARGRLLQYASATSEKRAIKKVFVFDGVWPIDQQELLALSGWETIIPVFELERYLSNL